jgi:hypothetical protein
MTTTTSSPAPPGLSALPEAARQPLLALTDGLQKAAGSNLAARCAAAGCRRRATST